MSLQTFKDLSANIRRPRSDKELVLQAFKRSRAVWQVLVDLGVADPVEALPGPSVQTDEQIMQYIGEAMITVSPWMVVLK